MRKRTITQSLCRPSLVPQKAVFAEPGSLPHPSDNFLRQINTFQVTSTPLAGDNRNVFPKGPSFITCCACTVILKDYGNLRSKDFVYVK